MTRNLKALGLALLAICALGAVAAQGASANGEHQFHSDGNNTAIVGKNVGTEKFAVGTAGTVECTTSEFEATQSGTKVGEAETYEADTLTVTPHYSGCTFGGKPATVNFNHCAYVFDSDTGEDEHGDVEVKCAKNEKGEEISRIEIDTSICTIIIKGQTVANAVHYENDTAKSIKVQSTAEKVVTGKEKTTEAQTGCVLFPTGAIGKYTGTSTATCFKGEGGPLTEENGTKTTTPTGLTSKGSETECKVSNL